MHNRQWAWWGCLVLGMVVCGLLTDVHAQEKKTTKVDPTGTWSWERTFRQQTIKSILKLELKGSTVTGTIKGRGDVIAIEKGKFEGDQLTFEYTRTRGDRRITVKYRGKVSASSITGKVEFTFGDQVRARDWVAKRAVSVADILGLWKFAFETRDGNAIDTSLKISLEGDALKGLHTSPWGELLAKKITLQGNVLSYELAGETDSGTFLVIYRGEVTGNAIKGTIRYQFGDREGTLKFTGKREVKKAPVKKPPAKKEPEKKTPPKKKVRDI